MRLRWYDGCMPPVKFALTTDSISKIMQTSHFRGKFEPQCARVNRCYCELCAKTDAIDNALRNLNKIRNLRDSSNHKIEFNCSNAWCACVCDL